MIDEHIYCIQIVDNREIFWCSEVGGIYQNTSYVEEKPCDFSRYVVMKSIKT